MNWTKRLGKWLVVSAVGGGTCVSVGCLSRPVGTEPPSTKVNFTKTVSQQQVDKVDLLFVIDNSASMGDKQEILADAVPTLLRGLLQPKCVDLNGQQVDGKSADPNGNQGNRYGCPANSEPEFRPVTDMHIGIVSSSLGGLAGDVCADTGRQNDKGHLLNLVKGGAPVAEASPSNFLSWYPSNDENKDLVRHPAPPTTPILDLTTLEARFKSLVTGVEQTGCGLEAQLESFYRFLIQPDPWVRVTTSGDRATLGPDNEVDVELLNQRADFLREDSLVAIIELTDEDDSSADPLSLGGQGFAFMSTKFPGSSVFRSDGTSTTAPRATSACQTDPGSPDCDSCALAKNRATDPECQLNGGYYGPTEDSLNVRFHQMKRRFGRDPQYPIQRYVDGLTKPRVPNRASEHIVKPGDIGPYVLPSAPTCTNPLFAKALPRDETDPKRLCDLKRSTRDPSLIFFAVVGGVPNTLLHFDPNDAEKSVINEQDWVKILGRDPSRYDYEGIDPHMIQSTRPREGIPGPATAGNGNPSDPVGRDWDTADDDLQYACTFDLPTPRECAGKGDSCDCDGKKKPPLCDPAKATTQIKAKAYPTTREFMVVRALKDQGIIASLCPIQLNAADKNSPTYGYNPAVKSIIDRLKNALTVQCLPQALTRDTASTDPNDKDKVPCLVLAQLAEGTQATACDPAKGLKQPAPEILSKFLEAQKAASGNVAAGGEDLSKRPVCELAQLVTPPGESCQKSPEYGWCYVENGNGKSPAGKKCTQALLFSESTGALAGANFSLQCIQQFSQTEPDAAPPAK